MLIKEFTVDRLPVSIFSTREEMASSAAKDIAAAINTVAEEKGEVNVMFAAAPSQNDVLSALYRDDSIPWDKVNAFHMDEYIGLPAEHPAGFGNFLTRAIFSKASFKSVHLINGGAADPRQEAVRYTALLKEHPIDICLLGVGENGHLAFNDPPVADFSDSVWVKIVQLDDVCRQQQVNDGCFASKSEVPTHALTVTIPGLMAGKQLFCIVPTCRKAAAIGALVHGPVGTACPASAMRLHKCAHLYLDAEAAGEVL